MEKLIDCTVVVLQPWWDLTMTVESAAVHLFYWQVYHVAEYRLHYVWFLGVYLVPIAKWVFKAKNVNSILKVHGYHNCCLINAQI